MSSLGPCECRRTQQYLESLAWWATLRSTRRAALYVFRINDHPSDVFTELPQDYGQTGPSFLGTL